MPKPAALTEARPEPDRVLAARERQQRYRQRRRDGLVTLSVTSTRWRSPRSSSRPAICGPARSWSGRSPDGATVVLTFWQDRLNYKTKPISYDDFGWDRYPIERLPGNTERKANIRWALDHLDGIVRVVIAKAVDTKAVPRKIAECFPQKSLTMRITEFDEAKGEFRAVAVENPRIEDRPCKPNKAGGVWPNGYG